MYLQFEQNLDRDGNGTIDINELAAGMRQGGKNVTDEEVEVFNLLVQWNIVFLYLGGGNDSFGQGSR